MCETQGLLRRTDPRKCIVVAKLKLVLTHAKQHSAVLYGTRDVNMHISRVLRRIQQKHSNIDPIRILTNRESKSKSTSTAIETLILALGDHESHYGAVVGL
jgi:hypothetical protein